MGESLDYRLNTRLLDELGAAIRERKPRLAIGFKFLRNRLTLARPPTVSETQKPARKPLKSDEKQIQIPLMSCVHTSSQVILPQNKNRTGGVS